MAASTLLMKMIATDDKPFPEAIRKQNHALLLTHLNDLRLGRADFKAIKYLANAVNYVHGFNKNGFIAEDIEEPHNAAAKALSDAAHRKPWKATEEEYEKILVILNIWNEITEQASEQLIREIQHEIDFACPEAKALRESEKRRVSKRSHRKPKKKSKR